MNQYSDKQKEALADRLRTGNRDAAAELVDMYYKQIYLFMRRLGHGSQISEDLTQESFLRVWQHIGQLKSGKTLNGWIYRIASNTSKLYRRKNRDKNLFAFEQLDVPDNKMPDDNQEAVQNEQITRLKNVVDVLPMKSKQIIILHYMQNLTIAEAAEAIGIRQGTFKSRLNRALKNLRNQVLSKNGELL
ncbi:MAG: RNA polymerase sigma factor [Sedimentisphaerales bacterium]|jgi:RNA polymerase sigma factor (sigma-70 family)|nr:RNA polymerase sigma factor [Sedimentisphaerales bacterium]